MAAVTLEKVIQQLNDTCTAVDAGLCKKSKSYSNFSHIVKRAASAFEEDLSRGEKLGAYAGISPITSRLAKISPLVDLSWKSLLVSAVVKTVAGVFFSASISGFLAIAAMVMTARYVANYHTTGLFSGITQKLDDLYNGTSSLERDLKTPVFTFRVLNSTDKLIAMEDSDKRSEFAEKLAIRVGGVGLAGFLLVSTGFAVTAAAATYSYIMYDALQPTKVELGVLYAAVKV